MMMMAAGWRRGFMLHLDEIAHLIATLAYIGGDDGIVCAFFLLFPFFNSVCRHTELSCCLFFDVALCFELCLCVC